MLEGIQDLLADYADGPQQLRDAVAGMTDKDMRACPVAGKWSTRQVVCHIADFEPVYADRIKRVLAENEPTFFGGDPEVFADHLAYDVRDIENELQLIEVVRQQMLAILADADAEDFDRVGHHSVDGPLTVRELLERITNHIPHHIQFIQMKRNALTRASADCPWEK